MVDILRQIFESICLLLFLGRIYKVNLVSWDDQKIIEGNVEKYAIEELGSNKK